MKLSLSPKLVEKTSLGPSYFIPSYAFDALLCRNWPFSRPLIAWLHGYVTLLLHLDGWMDVAVFFFSSLYFVMLLKCWRILSQIWQYWAKFGNIQNRKVKKKNFLRTLSCRRHLWQFLANAIKTFFWVVFGLIVSQKKGIYDRIFLIKK
jgi:hypothetical protein